MTSSAEIPDRPEHISRTLKQLACEHPNRVNTRTFADPAETWHCPDCGANWTDAP